ncbi:MAG: hypothetical protein WC551_09850 [Patescibacteria group bacterium]
MNNDQLIRSLRTVPEVKLEIIRLSWEVVDKNGKLDMSKAAFLAKEIALAGDEAQAYISASQKIRWSLRNLLQKSR